MKINREIIAKLNPCRESYEQGLVDYPDWEGTFIDFLSLDRIKAEDKIWVFSKLPFKKKLKREFVFMCAARVVEECNCQEIKDYFMLVLLKHEAGTLEDKDEEYCAARFAAYYAAYYAAASFAAYYAAAYYAAGSAAHYAAYYAAYYAADNAADSAAERKVQIDMLRDLIEGE